MSARQQAIVTSRQRSEIVFLAFANNDMIRSFVSPAVMNNVKYVRTVTEQM
jgi:hypothetical protein